jgi:hypothetical protein
MSGYSSPAPSDSDLLHGAGQNGAVLHDSSRHADITSSTRKGPDSGMSMSRPPRRGSDMSGPSPEDHAVAPGQRTVLAPRGTPSPSKMY